jgi:hypothetical protein
MTKILLKAGGPSIAMVVCPLCLDDKIVFGQCVKNDGQCSYFVSCGDTIQNGVKRTALECTHPDIDKLNTYTEIDL